MGKEHNHILCNNVQIGNNVILEDDVWIGENTIVRDNVRICANTTVGANCILGEHLADFYNDPRGTYHHPLTIGANSVIRSHSVIYGQNEIGAFFQTGHHVTIRENAQIGMHVSIGTLSDIQGDCKIGDYTRLHSNVHVGQKTILGSYVWVFPYVIFTNDPTPPSETLFGVTVDDFAIVATGSVILPGIHIAEDAMIGAGSVVTKDVPAGMVCVGNPAKPRLHVTEIKSKVTGKPVYPWRYTFKRGLPWAEQGYEEWYRQACDSID